jgi:hypothetical protein
VGVFESVFVGVFVGLGFVVVVVVGVGDFKSVVSSLVAIGVGVTFPVVCFCETMYFW